jgi:hypothetical protein
MNETYFLLAERAQPEMSNVPFSAVAAHFNGNSATPH